MSAPAIHAPQEVFDFSNPKLYNAAYIPLFRNKAEFLHLWGSAGSGKSRFAAQKEIVKSFNPYRKRRKTIVARKVYSTIKESCYDELKAVIYEWKLDDCFEITKSPLHITNNRTGVEFVFRGFDDIEKIKSIVGADRAWYEETTESSNIEEINQLRTRLRGFREVQVTLSYNPIDEHHWINEEIHIPGAPGHFLHHSTYKDNDRLLEKDPNYAPFLESQEFTAPNYYRVYALGLWGKVVEGLIYREFTLEDDFPKDHTGADDVHHYGLDFGFSNPCALIAQHVQDAAPKKKLINKQVLYEAGLDGPALVRRFDHLRVRKDRWIVADNARPEMIKSLRDAGYKVTECIKFGGSVLSGINDVRKFELCITRGSKEVIKEARNYVKNQKEGIWQEEPDTNQVDHGMDAIRYAVQRAIRPGKRRSKATSTSSSIWD